MGGEVTTAPLDGLDRRYRALRLPCPPSQRARLADSIRREGVRDALLTSSGVEGGRLVLIDGFKRVELIEELGAKETLVRVVELDAADALAMILTANARWSRPSEIEEAWVLRVLARDHGKTQDEIGALVGRHKSWVCRRIRLVTQLERVVQDDVRVGLLSPTVARELARLPRGNQAAAAQAVIHHGLASRQATRLVELLVASTPERRREVLSDPVAHLSAAAESSDPSPRSTADRLRGAFVRLHAAACQLEQALLGEASPDLAVVRNVAGPTEVKLRVLVERIGELSREREAAGAR